MQLTRPIDAVEVVKDMGDDEHAGPRLAPGKQLLPKVRVRPLVESLIGLVEEDEPRAIDAAEHHVELLLCAARKASRT